MSECLFKKKNDEALVPPKLENNRSLRALRHFFSDFRDVYVSFLTPILPCLWWFTRGSFNARVLSAGSRDVTRWVLKHTPLPVGQIRGVRWLPCTYPVTSATVTCTNVKKYRPHQNKKIKKWRLNRKQMGKGHKLSTINWGMLSHMSWRSVPCPSLSA